MSSSLLINRICITDRALFFFFFLCNLQRPVSTSVPIGLLEFLLEAETIIAEVVTLILTHALSTT